MVDELHPNNRSEALDSRLPEPPPSPFFEASPKAAVITHNPYDQRCWLGIDDSQGRVARVFFRKDIDVRGE